MEDIIFIVAIVVLIIILVVLFGPCSTAPSAPAAQPAPASNSSSVATIGGAVAAATGLTTAVNVANAVTGAVSTPAASATVAAAATPTPTPAASTTPAASATAGANPADATERMYVFRAPRKPSPERLTLPSPAAVAGTVGKIGQGVRNVVKGKGAFGSAQPLGAKSSTPNTAASLFDKYEGMTTVKNTKKHHGKSEKFVDGLGRQQSFMYYRVGNPGSMGSGPIAKGSVPSAGPKIERFAMPGSLSDMLSDTQDAVGQAWSGLSAPFQR